MATIQEQTYLLGRVYGLCAARMPSLRTNQQVANAAINPMSAATKAILRLHRNRKMNEQTNALIGNLMESVEIDYPESIPIVTQGAWWKGYYETIPRGIAELRRANDMTQPELSRITGIPQSDISNYERGSRVPTKENLAKIAAALKCSIEQLSTLEN